MNGEIKKEKGIVQNLWQLYVKNECHEAVAFSTITIPQGHQLLANVQFVWNDALVVLMANNDSVLS